MNPRATSLRQTRSADLYGRLFSAGATLNRSGSGINPNATFLLRLH